MNSSLALYPDRSYDIETIIQAVKNDHSLELTSQVEESISESFESFEELTEQDVQIYGTTTGFGPLVEFPSDSDRRMHGENLINHLGAGTGDPLPSFVVRTAAVIRAITLGRGFSAIRPSTYRQYVSLINTAPTPSVPETGSVGASGDLIPMANLVLALTGSGEFLETNDTDDPVSSSHYFESSESSPLDLSGRDALALVNGVPFSTAFGLISISESMHLVDQLEKSTAWLYSRLGCRKDALGNVLNSVKGHPQQANAAENIRDYIQELGNYEETQDRPLQEIYSIRSTPQVIGAFRTIIEQTRENIANELNGVDDNPVFENDPEPRVSHGANFVGQHLAFALDQLNNGLTQIGNLLHRHLSLLLDPQTNNGLNKLLAPEPGTTSGLAGVELNATAILSEMRNDCQNRASSSLQTNGENQDIVPMAFEAGKSTLRQLDRVYTLFSTVVIALSQHGHLDRKRSNGQPKHWFPTIEPLDDDRPLRREISRLTSELRDLKLDHTTDPSSATSVHEV